VKKKSSTQLTDNELDSFSFRYTKAMSQSLGDVSIFSKPHATLGLPINERPVGRRKVTLSENVVGEMSNLLQLDILVQTDSLSGDFGGRGINIAVCEPQGSRNVLCESINIRLVDMKNTHRQKD